MQQEITRVALDAMGGDNAPGELVKGAVDAVEWQIRTSRCYLVGQQDVVRERTETVLLPKRTD